MELLRAGDIDGLNGLLSREPGAIRHLIGRLWDNDDEMRALAARGLGAAAVAHPEQARDLVRRLMWALNDESAMNGISLYVIIIFALFLIAKGCWNFFCT